MTGLPAEAERWLAERGVRSRAAEMRPNRANVTTLEGPDVADAAFTGDPAWDIEAGLGYLDSDELDDWAGPWPDVPPAIARERLEAFVARAAASLG